MSTPQALARTPLNQGLSAFCADYEAWLIPRGVDDEPLGRLTGWASLSWQRIRNGVSQAQIRFDNVVALTPECCRTMQNLRAWATELQIMRRDTGEVWVGPILNAPVQNGSMTITAYDLGKWLDRRRIHGAYNVVDEEARDLFVALWHDAIDLENGMRFQIAPGAPTGVLAPFSYDGTFGSAQQASSALSQLVSSAVDYTTVLRTMTAGAPDSTLLASQITDQLIVGTPDYDGSGENQTNDLIVIGQAQGGGGAAAPAANRRADGSFRQRDGLLERIDTDQSLQTQAEVDAAADQRIAIYSDSPATVSSVRLKPRAPYDMNSDLVPGRLVDLRLGDLCRPIMGIYRIQEVNVSAAADAEGGGEVASLSLQYEAATIDQLPILGVGP